MNFQDISVWSHSSDRWCLYMRVLRYSDEACADETFIITYTDDEDFKIRVEIISGQETPDGACNGGIAINGISGTISSPNYPGFYLDNTVCQWTITSPNGTRISVKFEELFEIEPNGEALCYDTLLFEEPTNILSVCGLTTYPSFVSSGNALDVKFSSDISVFYRGFSFNWTAVESSSIPEPSYSNFTTTNGLISTPNYPQPYDPLLEYVWEVTNGTPGKYKLVEFDSPFGIEGFGNDVCPYDALIIEEPISGLSNRFCNYDTPTKHLVQGKDMRITFNSDISFENVGFSLRFKEIDPPTCNAEAYQNGTSGVISTPLFPLNYAGGLACTWFIRAPENTLIAVRFDPLFQIEGSTNCLKSYLQIFDGPSTSSIQFQEDICGENAPRNFLSSGSSLTVRFVSSSFSPQLGLGFSFNWTTEAVCEAGRFRCWDGTCINGTLKCNGIVDCPTDVADEAVCSKESTAQCGIPEISPVFQWDARIIGGSEARKGSWPWQGQLHFYFQNRSTFLCGAVLIAEEWAMTAAHCIVTKGLPMQLTFGDHSVSEYEPESEQTVAVDVVFIPPEYRNDLENPWRYGSDIALLHLKKSVNITKYVKPACLPTLPLTSETTLVITGWGVTSFQSSLSKVDILHQVRAPVVSRNVCNKVQGYDDIPESVFCAGLETGGAAACHGDSGGPAVQLVDGSWQVAGIVSFGQQCGTARGKPSGYADVYQLLPFVNLVLVSGITEPRITTTVIKDQTSGVITSPNYGEGKYPQNLAMRWFLIGPENTVLTVRFDSNFSIEFNDYGTHCTEEYLLVYDGSSSASNKYGNKKLCGTVTPPDFESNSNSLIVEFRTDFAFESTGFRITWSAVDACQSDEFRCWNTTCIPGDAQCDGKKNCMDQEDEFECAHGEPASPECGKASIAPEIPWNPLIINGHNAREGAWPWQVGVYANFDGVYEFVCGGSLVAKDLVMTAAHCLGISPLYQVSVGDYDLSTTSLHERRINVTVEFIPPGYFGFQNDIGLLKLAEEVDFTSRWTKPVCLPSKVGTEPKPNTTCIVTGWGVTGIVRGLDVPNILQQTPARILNNSNCDEIFIGNPESQNNFICAGFDHERSSSCYGDSGGPLVCLEEGSWVQYGIVSFGTVCGLRAFYERVSLHLDFIEDARNYRDCSKNEVRESTSGTIILPTLTGYYIPNLDCGWLLRGPPDTVLEIQFDFFDVETCVSTYYDYVNVHDGNSTSARKFLDEPICGKNLSIRGFESSSNEVFITFISDVSFQRQGFKIKWRAVEKCDLESFRCWDGSCIDKNLECDHKVDCPDKSDEAGCSQVGMEECGRQDIEPEFLWSARIAGGSFTKNGSWPFQVYLKNAYEYFCAGTIINSRWILTSADCVDITFGYATVVVGEIDIYKDPEDSKLYIVEETFVPNEYHLEDAGYNIGLLKLSRNIEFSSLVQPACLALYNTTDLLEAGETCVLLGWGYTATNRQSNLLRQTRVPIIEQDVCKKILNSFHRDRMFCGGNLDNGGVGACWSDFGGPVMCFRHNVWVQFGILTGEHGCAVPGNPDLYTKVSFFTEWIEQTINATLPSEPPPHTPPPDEQTTPCVTTQDTTTQPPTPPSAWTTTQHVTTQETITQAVSVAHSENVTNTELTTTKLTSTTNGCSKRNFNWFFVFLTVLLLHL